MSGVSSRSFEEAYWAANYACPENMDGIGNAREHARYLKAFFEVEGAEVDSLVDLGFGLGYQFQEMLYLFSPRRAVGIDPSRVAHARIGERDLDPYHRIDIALRQQRLEDWCAGPAEDFDLAVCMSVFQYLEDQALRDCLPVLASRVGILYLTVPTDVELERQVAQCDFRDEWAIWRSRDWYQRELGREFTFIGSRILESRQLANERTTPFTDLLYRWPVDR